MSRRRSSCAAHSVNTLTTVGPQLERRQVIKVGLDLKTLVFLLICQNMKAAKTTMLVVTVLIVCYLPLIVKWQVWSMAKSVLK